MAVYVDDMYKSGMGQFGRMKMSHLIADTTEELLEMVDKIGVQRKWIQHAGTKHEHFDISMAKRELAIKQGAIPLTMRELGKKLLEKEENKKSKCPQCTKPLEEKPSGVECSHCGYWFCY